MAHFSLLLKQKLSEIPFIENSNLESRIIISHLLSVDEHHFFLLDRNREISKEIEISGLEMVEERKKGRSLAAILGYQFFYDCKLLVSDLVLIPRPETEFLVTEAMELIEKYHFSDLLDVGCGAGAITIALAKNATGIFIDALDCSEEAIRLLLENIRENEVTAGKINPILQNFFQFTPQKSYDLILSNPPYIRTAVVREILERHDVDDPPIALDGGNDGLTFYRELFRFSRSHLKEGGYLVMEHGFDQREELKTLFSQTPFLYLETKKDYGENDRITIVYREKTR